VKAGESVAEFTQHVDSDQTFRYSPASGDPMPIHLDAHVARDAGLPGIIAHGFCMLAFASWGILQALGGEDVARLKRLAVRFSKPVLPGQDINTRVWRNDATTYAFETDVDGTPVLRDGLAEVEER
jgi:acyl dehydratase